MYILYVSLRCCLLVEAEVVREMEKESDAEATMVMTGGEMGRGTGDVIEAGVIGTEAGRTGDTGNESGTRIHAEGIGHGQDRHVVHVASCQENYIAGHDTPLHSCM